MKAHNRRPILRRQNFVLLTTLFLFWLVAVCGFMVGAARSSAAVDGVMGGNIQSPAIPGPTGEDIKKEFNDDDLKVKGEKPRGKWGFTTLPDTGQLKDSSLPAYVNGIQLLSGGGKHIGITKIKRVQVVNRSSKIVNSVQLRWAVVSLDDQEEVLSEDTPPSVNVWVEAKSSQVIEIPTLYPVRMLKPLAKNGELYGRFQITIGVQEVRFADGSFWRRQEPIALLKSVYLAQPLDGRFPSLASLVPDIIPLLISPTDNQIRSSPCGYS